MAFGSSKVSVRTVNESPPLVISEWAGTPDPSPAQVLHMAREHGVRMVDFKFTDLPGMWQHITLSINALDEAAFEEGLGFDGSSIRGFQEISESDMIMVPDPATAAIDPFHEQRALSIVCNIFDPITREPYSRDPRYVAQKAEGWGEGGRNVEGGNPGLTLPPGGGHFPAPPADTHSDLRSRMVVVLEQM